MRNTHSIPLDYSLCTMTVTVLSPDGTRRRLEGVHYEFTDTLETTQGRSHKGREFLLVIPGQDPIGVGDKVVLGDAPDLPWDHLNPAQIPTLGVVRTVKPRFFRGTPCHTEARS